MAEPNSIWSYSTTSLDRYSHRMTITHDQLERLLASGETQTVEFKERIRDSRILARLFSGMANSAGGVVLVGLREPRSIVGVDRLELQRTYEAALRSVRPPPPTELSFHALDGKEVGVIEIGPGAGPVLSDEGAFVRVAASTRPMDASAIAFSLAKLPDLPVEERNALAEGIAGLTRTVAELNAKVDRANSFRGQLPNYLIGGIIGAVFGWLVTLL